MFFLQIPVDINIFDYLLDGSPWGVGILFLFLYLQEKKYARELTQKTTELVLMINTFKEQLASQNGQWQDVTKMGIKIDHLLETANEIKRLISK